MLNLGNCNFQTSPSSKLENFRASSTTYVHALGYHYIKNHYSTLIVPLVRPSFYLALKNLGTGSNIMFDSTLIIKARVIYFSSKI
jgi:hypothetical protein